MPPQQMPDVKPVPISSRMYDYDTKSLESLLIFFLSYLNIELLCEWWSWRYNVSFLAAELQLTFPIKDGIIMPPFRLQHNLPITNHMFHLKEQIYQTLMER